MKLIHAATELNAGSRPVCFAIGVFDGVHLGHQAVIRKTIAEARPAQADATVITFDRHPNVVVAPDRVPPLIYSLPQKLRAIAALGTDATLLLHFDEALSRQTGEQFIRRLARDFGRLDTVCVGGDFTFGYKRSGNVTLLKTLGAELNFKVHGLDAVVLADDVISSTRIREAILAGHLAEASRLLGRAYALSGPVVRGDGLGRKLGFPTANLDTAGLALPPNGVYAGHALFEGKKHPAVLNLGVRPTLASVAPRLRVEAHLLDFSGDLYGQELELTIVARLREEQKFASLDALRRQIVRDLAAARQRLG